MHSWPKQCYHYKPNLSHFIPKIKLPPLFHGTFRWRLRLWWITFLEWQLSHLNTDKIQTLYLGWVRLILFGIFGIFVCRLDNQKKDNFSKFKITSDWECGQWSEACQSEGLGQAGEMGSQELHAPCSSWMSHSMKDVQSLMEVTKVAKDLEHMGSQK